MARVKREIKNTEYRIKPVPQWHKNSLECHRPRFLHYVAEKPRSHFHWWNPLESPERTLRITWRVDPRRVPMTSCKMRAHPLPPPTSPYALTHPAQTASSRDSAIAGSAPSLRVCRTSNKNDISARLSCLHPPCSTLGLINTEKVNLPNPLISGLAHCPINQD